MPPLFCPKVSQRKVSKIAVHPGHPLYSDTLLGILMLLVQAPLHTNRKKSMLEGETGSKRRN